MSGKLQREIKKLRPFDSSAQELFLNVLRTADALSRDSGEFLKPYALSPTQYNLLRILRGAGEPGLACREIAGRMITRDPDMTRLLDRLERRGLVKRSRQTDDRRVVCTEVTSAGLELLATIDGPLKRMHERYFSNLTEAERKKLIDLLEKAREGVGS